MRHRPTRLSTALDPLFLGCLDAVRTFLYATRIDRDTSHHAISALPPLYRRDYASLAGLGGYLPHYFGSLGVGVPSWPPVGAGVN